MKIVYHTNSSTIIVEQTVLVLQKNLTEFFFYMSVGCYSSKEGEKQLRSLLNTFCFIKCIA